MSPSSDNPPSSARSDPSARASKPDSGVMVGGVAHDLNNVLGHVLMAAELLQTMPVGPEVHNLAEGMLRSARHGAALVHQLLAFARGEVESPAPLAIEPFLHEFVALVSQSLGAGIRVRLEGGCEQEKIRADHTQLKQVLMNLCLNARDAMPDGGEIRLGVRRVRFDDAEARALPEGRAGEFLVLSVSDHGVGIPPADLERIFEPFFSTKEAGRGTGLGLSTVRGIVRGHGGFVTVASEMNRGTTFAIHLPVAFATATAGTEDPDILLVDDDAMVCETLALLLKSSGYRVHAATDAAAARAWCRRHQPRLRLLITDLKMPGLTGLELLAALQPSWPALRCIVLTGAASPEEQVTINHAGARLLRKPVTRGTLLNTVEAVLAARPATPEPRPAAATSPAVPVRQAID